MQESRVVAEKLHDAVVKFDMYAYRNLRRHGIPRFSLDSTALVFWKSNVGYALYSVLFIIIKTMQYAAQYTMTCHATLQQVNKLVVVRFHHTVKIFLSFCYACQYCSENRPVTDREQTFSGGLRCWCRQ